MIKAKVIADSITLDGDRLTTMELTFHRFILSEFNTHRAFSRNSASSRARSVAQTIVEVDANPAMPLRWTSEQHGMSGGDIPSSSAMAVSADSIWYYGAREAIERARQLSVVGVHKSLINRLLEPFMWHTVVVTATDWDNFFAQRLALLEDGQTPASQPEMYELAQQMKIALGDSYPQTINDDEWHRPYITPMDIAFVHQKTDKAQWDERLCQISVARCAGVSYLTHDRVGRNHDKDVALYHRLRNAEPPHWSPFEHVALPGKHNVYYDNFRGWCSYRSHLRETE